MKYVPIRIIDSTYQTHTYILHMHTDDSIEIISTGKKEKSEKMETQAKRNNVTFDGNQQYIDLRVSKLCSTHVFFLYFVYSKSFPINLTECANGSNVI